MSLIGKILDNPKIWDISQAIFGCDAQKRKLYRSVFKAKGRILDFGCADGNTFAAFSDWDYYGIDINTRLIEYARKKYSSFQNAHFVNADMLDKPFKEGYFDYVLFACTGHHLEDAKLFPIMKELAGVLKENGRMFIFDTIKRPGKDSALLKFLINLDQGKFMRNEDIYRSIINRFSDRLKPVRTEIMRIKGALMPQPTYFFAEFVKI